MQSTFCLAKPHVSRSSISAQPTRVIAKAPLPLSDPMLSMTGEGRTRAEMVYEIARDGRIAVRGHRFRQHLELFFCSKKKACSLNSLMNCRVFICGDYDRRGRDAAAELNIARCGCCRFDPGATPDGRPGIGLRKGGNADQTEQREDSHKHR